MSRAFLTLNPSAQEAIKKRIPHRLMSFLAGAGKEAVDDLLDTLAMAHDCGAAPYTHGSVTGWEHMRNSIDMLYNAHRPVKIFPDSALEDVVRMAGEKGPNPRHVSTRELLGMIQSPLEDLIDTAKGIAIDPVHHDHCRVLGIDPLTGDNIDRSKKDAQSCPHKHEEERFEDDGGPPRKEPDEHCESLAKMGVDFAAINREFSRR